MVRTQGGPKLVRLRFEAEHAGVWLDESNTLASARMLSGADPKKEYEDKVRDIDLR